MIKKCTVLTGLPIDGVGPSEACRNVCKFWPSLGRKTRIYTPRLSIRDTENVCRPSLPRALSWLPYKVTKKWLLASTETRCSSKVKPSDILYVWPGGKRLDLIEQAKSRGSIIIKENINTHTRYAKRILDKAYQEFGLDESHITEEMIQGEDRILDLSDYVFSPSYFVGESLRESGVPDNQILESSYGCSVPDEGAIKNNYRSNGVLSFLFVGSFSIRKGAHKLLEAWQAAGYPGELVIVGKIDQLIANKYPDLLNHHSVRKLGFVHDLNSIYKNADVFVFPSLEEGDPLVSYGAASFGLPKIVTKMGGGRASKADRNSLIIDLADAEHLQEAIITLAQSEDLREYLGKNAREDAKQYDWRLVSERRHEMMLDLVND